MSKYVDETIEKYGKFINPSTARLFRFMGLDSVEGSARGWTITDTEGKEFIDFLGGYGMFAVGHRHPKVVEACKNALDTMPMCGKILFNRPMVDLAEKIAELTPGDLQYTFFVNSGTEAVEATLKFARLATGKKKYISTINSFHGKTYGALTATGRDLFRKPFEPLMENFTHVPYGDIKAIKEAIDDETAAIILEPIQGEGGIIVPPEGYLKQVSALCKEKDVLLIADEVQTGFGRTGKWFGVNHDDVEPDLIAVAKALGGGVVPIGASIATPKVWEKMIESPFLHTSTFGGNQIASMAGLATIKIIEEEKLLDKVAADGEYFKQELKKIQKEFPKVIREVRGKGFMLGLELTKEGAGGMLMALMIEKQIIIAYTLNNPKVIRMEPPLITPREVINHVLDVLHDSIKQIDAVIDDL